MASTADVAHAALIVDGLFLNRPELRGILKSDGAPFQPEELTAMLELARQGLQQLFALQQAALQDAV